jgi:glycosyltransferase involved in cell wall biosynthesis
MVVRNEDTVIERCLDSLDGVVHEIVLVHDGDCEDRTLDIAEGRGCRTFVRPLVGHSEGSKVFAFEQARGEWILAIDADEFLSERLREQLPRLVDNAEVNGYELLWRSWDGRRYITENGPYKLALYRRSNVHLLGIIHGIPRVDGPVVKTELQLEHRPLYNNFSLRTVLTKWRRWARINASEFLMPFGRIPKFNWNGPDEWPRRRRILNRLSPALFLPYMPVVIALNVWREHRFAPLVRNLRMAFYQGVYASMVQFYVAKYLYLGVETSAPREPPRPAPSPPPR